jgi:prepilin signal peptidase PulO-like enzyme (type II secretory pathway)
MPANAVAAVALAVAGVTLSPLLARHAARRAAAQPVTYDGDAERVLLAGAYDNPEHLDELIAAGVGVATFTCADRQAAWSALSARAGAGPLSLSDVAGVRLELSDAAADALADASRVATDVQASSGLDLGAAAGRALDAADDRHRFPGRNPYEQTWSEPPLRRSEARPTAGGYAVAAAVMAFFGAVAGAWAVGPWTAAVLFAVGVYSYIVSTVDHATMLLDDRTTVIGSVGGWALVAAAAVSGELSWADAGKGAVLVALVAVTFELINAAYKRLRGHDGLGFGDALILIVCGGIPTALSGSWWVGFYSVVAAFALAGVVSVPLMLLGKRDRTTPFALGPYLAVGWVASWAAAKMLGLA